MLERIRKNARQLAAWIEARQLPSGVIPMAHHASLRRQLLDFQAQLCRSHDKLTLVMRDGYSVLLSATRPPGMPDASDNTRLHQVSALLADNRVEFPADDHYDAACVRQFAIDPNWAGAALQACRLVAAKPEERRGRAREYDEKADDDLFSAYQAGGFKTRAEAVTVLRQRERWSSLTIKGLRKAQDRVSHRRKKPVKVNL